MDAIHIIDRILEIIGAQTLTVPYVYETVGKLGGDAGTEDLLLDGIPYLDAILGHLGGHKAVQLRAHGGKFLAQAFIFGLQGLLVLGCGGICRNNEQQQKEKIFHPHQNLIPRLTPKAEPPGVKA